MRPTNELYPPPGVDYGAAAVALERLGITGAELAILNRPDALADWQTLYGYDPATVSQATALAALINAKALSRRLDVTYRDLVALIRTGFVNPRLDTLVTLRKLGVDTEDVLRYMNQPGSAPFHPGRARRVRGEARDRRVWPGCSRPGPAATSAASWCSPTRTPAAASIRPPFGTRTARRPNRWSWCC